MRVAIAGVPRAGKTTRATALATPDSLTVLHTDMLIGQHDWSALSSVVATWFDAPGPWIIEGVAVARALRKWLGTHAAGAPCDRVVWLDRPRTRLAGKVQAMATSTRACFRAIEGELRQRGVEVVRG